MRIKSIGKRLRDERESEGRDREGGTGIRGWEGLSG